MSKSCHVWRLGWGKAAGGGDALPMPLEVLCSRDQYSYSNNDIGNTAVILYDTRKVSLEYATS